MTIEPMLSRLDIEGRELMGQVAERGLATRLLGGMAIRLLLGDRLLPGFRRPVGDLDLITRRRDARALEELLGERGWLPDDQFNALNGARRMLFHDELGQTQVDVFVEAFEMCHTLPLGDRLAGPGPALPATDLLMTKLQIVELNAKDRSDLYALLVGCPIGDGAVDVLEPARLTDVTGRDWGVHHTFELNFGRLVECLPESGLSSEQQVDVSSRIRTLAEAMASAPKSRGFKLRAKVGERKRWYELPEEVDREPDA